MRLNTKEPLQNQYDVLFSIGSILAFHYWKIDLSFTNYKEYFFLFCIMCTYLKFRSSSTLYSAHQKGHFDIIKK